MTKNDFFIPGYKAFLKVFVRTFKIPRTDRSEVRENYANGPVVDFKCNPYANRRM